MKKILIPLFIMAAGFSTAQTVYKCYQSDNNTKLAIMAKSVDGTVVSVKYRGQKQAIPVRYAEQRAEDSELKEIYMERYNGKITGRYIFANGPENETLYYERMKDGKFFHFSLRNDWTYIDDAYRKTPCW